MKLKHIINWKLYFTLLTASAFSILAIMPYIISIQGDVLEQSPLPLPVVVLLAIIQSLIFVAIVLFVGLKLHQKLGFKMPLLENYLAKKEITVNIPSLVKTSVILGVLAGLAIILLDFIFIQLGVNIGGQISIPVWQGFLASFYGGITEEIIMRLFLMTFLVWLLAKLTRIQSDVLQKKWLIWSAIILAALIFGLGHLPITSSLTTITPLVVLRALLLNGVGGVIFGWLYWKKGLESAIIAHFSADIVLHVIFFPLIASL